MTLEEHFKACAELLQDWNHFLDYEPIRNYPDFRKRKINSWVEELQEKSLPELVELENNLTIKTRYQEFENLLQKIRSLIQFPMIKVSREDQQLISNKVKKKKMHEIKQIKAVLDPIENVTIVDIGSGAGHLSENLIHNRKRFSYCIDIDQNLQRVGEKRIKNNANKNLEKIEFKNICFDENTKFIPETSYDKKLILGLHACGDLTSDILHYFQKTKSEYILSVGCCYHMITHKYNLSRVAKEFGLQFTANAFNLAARCNAVHTEESLALKFKIREYRYGLHCYLYHLGHLDFFSIGKTKVTDYAESFGEYAQKYAPDLVISREHAQTFFESEINTQTTSSLIHTDIFRHVFGRLIETYIVLDRALFLEENNCEVNIHEIFEKQISPRNLAIIAGHKESNGLI